jgi:Clp amino terminal domain, pathogenicity island component
MMFERFTDTARQVVVQAQHSARRLGHNYIGCEHLLLAVAATSEPAGVVLRDQGLTPDRIEAEIVRTVGRGHAAGHGLRPGKHGQAMIPADPLGGLDREALAAIGIDLDVVRARIEAAFGPDALSRAVLAHRRGAQGRPRGRRPALGKGPVARLIHVRRARRARCGAPAGLAAPANAPLSQDAPPRHIPFTPRAKKSMELSLREAAALKDNYIGVQHLALALLAMNDGTVPRILSAIGTSSASLRTAILDRYRKAG